MEEETEDQEEIVFPEEAIRHLPEEWQKQIAALKEKGEAVLAVADDNLKIINRIARAFPTMASLRYIQHRLASTKFEATMEWAFENDMLILAFVTTYFRLMEGKGGSGVARDALPAELRPVHDNILELRHKRYAHNIGHPSIEGSLTVNFADEQFEVNLTYNMGFHVGGAPEWRPLVEFLDSLMLDRLHSQLNKLTEKTGHQWTFPSGGPTPVWAD